MLGHPTPTGPRSDPGLPPVSLRIAAALLVLLALVAAVLGVVEAASTQAHRAVVGVGGAILLLGYAAVLGFVARGLWRRRPWSRGPIVATQICQLPVAWSFVGGSTTWIGVLLGAVSLTIIICVLVPASTRVLVGGLAVRDEEESKSSGAG